MSAAKIRALRPASTGIPAESFATHEELMAARHLGFPYVQDSLAVLFDVDEATDEELFGPQPTARADLPDPHPTAAHLAQAVVEVVTGIRSPVQLLRCTSPEVYAVLARRAMLAQRRTREVGVPAGSRRPAVVRRVRVCEPVDGVAEVAAVVVDSGRIRALAMRLVGYDGGWRLTVLQLG